MFCNQCGARLAEGVAYCTQCGRAAVSAPPAAAVVPAVASAPAAGRVAHHRNLLAVFWIVLGALSLIGGVVLVIISRFRPWENPWSPPAPDFIAPLLGAIGMALLVFSVLRVLAGVGLLRYQNWARLLAIVLAVVSLVDVPIGTLLGIYTLWVLAPQASEAEYRALSENASRSYP